VTVRPATVSVAERDVLPRFAAIVNVTLPGPELPAFSVNHEAAPVVAHRHSACVVTVTALVPAEALTVRFSGDTA
jgi:hypothetical protein